MEAERAGAARLAVLSRDEDPAVRKAACDALGAVGGPVDALTERLADPEPAVRYAAAFALFRIATPEAAEALRRLLDAEDPNLRLLAVRGLPAAGQARDGHRLVEIARTDLEPAVRGAAAVGAGTVFGRAGRDAEGADDAQRALAARLRAEPAETVRWRLAWALTRFDGAPPEEVVPVLAEAVGPPRAERTPRPARWTRVMALRALGRGGPAARDTLVAALDDDDPQVLLAALRGLDAALGDGAPAPRELTQRPLPFEMERGRPAVLRRTIEVLEAHPVEPFADLLTEPGWVEAEPQDRELPSFVDHPEVPVRTAALVALAHRAPERAAPRVADRVEAADWRDRAAAARAARWLPPDAARPVLDRALDDADVRVRTAAVQALPGHGGAPWLDALLERAAGERDLAMREELGVTLAALAPGHAALAARAFADSEGEAFAEARKTLMEAVVAGDPHAAGLDDWLRARLDDPSLAVRRQAAGSLAARGADVPPFDATDAGPFPRVGNEVPVGFLGTRPVVVVETTRGTFEVTLMPAAAPVHAWNFLQLAADGRYDGRVFHRVVPDFVVQGGSARGDGYDNASWLGGRLRDEISPLPFLAGTVGMPKTADPDTGGGQFFVTLVPAPHLDGRYTAFGRVTAGLEVAESIQIGDVVVRMVPKPR